MEELHKGWLIKSPPEHKTMGPWKLFNSKWRKRYFVLFKPPSATSIPGSSCFAVLDYFVNEKMLQKKGSINLKECKSIKLTDNPIYLNTFKIETVDRDCHNIRNYTLSADSPEELEQWMQVLCNVVGIQNEKGLYEENCVPISPLRIINMVSNKSPDINENSLKKILLEDHLCPKTFIATPPNQDISYSPNSDYLPIENWSSGFLDNKSPPFTKPRAKHIENLKENRYQLPSKDYMEHINSKKINNNVIRHISMTDKSQTTLSNGDPSVINNEDIKNSHFDNKEEIPIYRIPLKKNMISKSQVPSSYITKIDDHDSIYKLPNHSSQKSFSDYCIPRFRTFSEDDQLNNIPRVNNLPLDIYSHVFDEAMQGTNVKEIINNNNTETSFPQRNEYYNLYSTPPHVPNKVLSNKIPRCGNTVLEKFNDNSNVYITHPRNQAIPINNISNPTYHYNSIEQPININNPNYVPLPTKKSSASSENSSFDEEDHLDIEHSYLINKLSSYKNSSIKSSNTATVNDHHISTDDFVLKLLNKEKSADNITVNQTAYLDLDLSTFSFLPKLDGDNPADRIEYNEIDYDKTKILNEVRQEVEKTRQYCLE